MEEDIKILEEMRKKMNKTLSHKIIKQEFQAIKNLIKGYRDSENIMENAVKENLELKEYIRDLEEQIDKHVYFETTNPKEIEKNYIPKSKVKEKIQELEKEYKKIEETSDFIIADIIQPKIQVLQELMEDK